MMVSDGPIWALIALAPSQQPPSSVAGIFLYYQNTI